MSAIQGRLAASSLASSLASPRAWVVAAALLTAAFDSAGADAAEYSAHPEFGRSEAFCAAISRWVGRDFLIFNPGGTQAYSTRSECFDTLAMRTRDLRFCREVKQRLSPLDGSFYTQARCEERVQAALRRDRAPKIDGERVHHLESVSVVEQAGTLSLEGRLRPTGQAVAGTYEVRMLLSAASRADMEGIIVGLETPPIELGPEATRLQVPLSLEDQARLKEAGARYRGTATLIVILQFLRSRDGALPENEFGREYKSRIEIPVR